MPFSALSRMPMSTPFTLRKQCKQHLLVLRLFVLHLFRQSMPKLAAMVIICGILVNVNHGVRAQIDGYIAGVDYPAYDSVPKKLSFKCQGRLPGYYADTEARCQVWHWCLHSGHQYSFLCPNGTIFNQAVRVCDWWSNVNCPASEQLYSNNDELYRSLDLNDAEEKISMQRNAKNL